MYGREAFARNWRMAMRISGGSAVLVAALALAGCTPDWATDNETPFIMEIAAINGGSPLQSDVSFPVVNNDAVVLVNIFRKNNNPELGTSPVEHVYLTRYEVRYFRSDGRDVEGVDVPFRITGPLGNLRFHTPGPGGGGEVENAVTITIVRHQAKLEPPLANLRGGFLTDTGTGQFPAAGVITMIAEITIYGKTVQDKGLKATGNVQVTFADFPDGN
jgi:hypothetical protein